ncbi:MAG: isocitrate lyase/phosphoenolpyruvate mutase family protein [Burkholderiaceae bacterium]
MSRFSARRERFRELLASEQCYHPASVHDPVSARIAEDLGFELGMFAGSVASLAVLGAPDLIVLTLSEFAEQARRICRAGQLPLLVDADHGYGNALNVMRTVEELDTAGVCALSIEDTDLPPRFGTGGKPALLSLEEGVGKMRAAVQARGADGPLIAGRTSAAGMTGVDDAIRRSIAYEQAGVDAIFLVGVKSRDDLDKIADALHLPLILGSAAKDMMDRDYLASRGVRVALQGHQPFAAATRALYETMRFLREGGDPAQVPGLADKALTRASTHADDYDDWQSRFLD